MFGPEAVQRLEFVQRLKSLGPTLQEIRDLNDAFETGHTPATRVRLGHDLRGYLERIRAKRK